jgi:ATP-dependent Clp protease ATP-binding subunit ClpC
LTHHLLGASELAALLGVSRQRADQLASTYPDFPKPAAELAAGRIWARDDVEAWLATHPRRRAGQQLGGGIMFERLSERARKVFVLAQEEARSFGHGYVGCEHLVIALLGEPEAVAARALATSGLTLAGARAALERVVGSGSGAGAEWQRLPFTPRVSHALAQAQDAAIELGHNLIGTEHLLLGVLREGENVGCRLLKEAGLDLSALRLRVLEEMGYPQPRPEPERDRQLSRILEKVTDQLADIDARLERLERQLA